MQSTHEQTPLPDRPARRAPLWMTAAAAAVGLPTLVVDIGDWTNTWIELPPSAHHVLVLATAMFALSAGMLFVVGELADWLDKRYAARVAGMEEQHDVRVGRVVDQFAARLLAIESTLRAAKLAPPVAVVGQKARWLNEARTGEDREQYWRVYADVMEDLSGLGGQPEAT